MQTTTTKTLRPLTDVSPDEFAQMIKEVRKEAGYMDAIKNLDNEVYAFYQHLFIPNHKMVGKLS